MGTLKIDCTVSESQMTTILKEVSSKLYASDPRDIEDFDDELHGVRICVDYSVMADTVSIKASEILDSDFDVLFEDSAVFTSRLRAIVKDYNDANKASYNQALQIQADQFNHVY